MKKPTSVDAYLKSVPKKFLPVLKALRRIIISAAPNALEKISYGMPYYDYKGRLAYFRLATKHVGLYVPGLSGSKYKHELEKFSTSNSATIRLPLDEKLPAGLITKIIKERIKINELAHKAKKK
jgi:uncharacterized protein YdhG (YjbR/CyaY superfamily)